ncbi:MAG TPA: hypothetical protein PKV24_20645, partial [Cyclobacteriaceae bacterium]|nr:hypothetical protein [Cyclobacteriaceae bacterium]
MIHCPLQWLASMHVVPIQKPINANPSILPDYCNRLLHFQWFIYTKYSLIQMLGAMPADTLKHAELAD